MSQEAKSFSCMPSSVLNLPEVVAKKFSSFEDKIGIRFEQFDFLVQAFVHRSYLNEHHDFPLGQNERLEFLGDAVLELIVTEFLFHEYANPEGDLTNLRAALVNANMLSVIAYEIGMEPYLFLSHGEAKDAGTKARNYIMANAIEALIGAIYLDKGYDLARQFVARWILGRIPYALEKRLDIDAKSRFQESAQELLGVTPTYKVLSEEGPDHAKMFKVGVYLDKDLVATGEGLSKQEAQTDAAEKAIVVKNWKGKAIALIPRQKGDGV